MSLIDRQAAIDILYNFAGCIVDTPNGDYRKAYEASRYKLETLPSAEPERWIPCSERPPEVGTTVFITKKPFKINGYEEEVVKAKRSVDPRSGEIKWWSPEFGTLTDKVVLAWMPMPEPYGGESK